MPSTETWTVIYSEDSEISQDITLFLLRKDGEYYIGYGEGEYPIVDDFMEFIEVGNFMDKVGEAEDYVSLLYKRECIYCSEDMPLEGHPKYLSLFACGECHNVIKTQFEEMIEGHSAEILADTV